MIDPKATARLRRALLLTVTPLFGLLAGPAYGQSATGDPGAILLDTVVVEAGGEGTDETGEIADVSEGNTIAVIDYTEIQELRPGSVQELFRRESAVAVGGTSTFNQKVYVHGIEETNLAVTIDGSRQNNKIFHHNATNVIDPRLLKVARVDAGVAAADAGPGAIAGSIAYETVDTGDLLEEGRNIGGYVEGRYDTNSETVNTYGSLYGRANGFEALGFLNWAEGDDYEDGNGDIVDYTGVDLISGLGKVAYESLSGDRVELSYERVKDDGVRPYRANIGAVIGGRPVPESRTYDIDRQNVVLSYENTLATGYWDPEITLAYSKTDLETTEQDPFTGRDIVYEASTDSLNGTIANEFHVSLGTIKVGVDAYSDTADFASETDRYRTEESADNFGGFVQARLRPIDPLLVSFGGRVDHQIFTGVDGMDQENTGASGNISLEYDLTEFFRLKGGYSNTFGGIALAENFIQNPDWIYTDIETVRGENVFAGFGVNHLGFTFDAQIFRTEIDNGRTPSFADPNATADFLSTGYDVALGYDWVTGNVRGTFTSIDTEVDGAPADSFLGTYFTVPVGELFTVAAVQRFDTYGLTLGADAQIALSEDAPTNDPTNPDLADSSLDGYTVVNAFLEYTPPSFKNVSFRAEVDNIFDEAYAERGTYGQEFTTVEPLLSPGRSFGFSTRVTF
ncbi:TonB-dependent receptor [Fulvimarina pelagi HTCC2506]|uniref:TonB-dependent receptor n=1 Tax=Fulvimarina pelagi HTCC2506 TaxID=314231 RepID=Q0G417_9HYPH|nr:TonB-dependent receptor [Fulvimarina pelagi]EAU41664.1 TonB-dependent receptor [Fulvimarina pelagi HTCC2506]